MTDQTGAMMRSTRNLSISVFASRVLGFFRDILMSAVVGGGALMSGWVLASTLANLLRRILGEGALGQALVPMLTSTLEKSGKERAERQFTLLLIFLTLLLSAITLAVSVPAYLIAPHLSAERWRLACRLIPVVMPYSIFICMVGVITARMNMARIYFLPSLTAILQNLVLIAALFLVWRRFSSWTLLKTLGFAVLISGLIEFLFMLWLLHRKKMPLRFSRKMGADRAFVLDTARLALPGMFAAAAYQLSVLADRTIAGWVGDYAVPALYYTERLVLLPVGVFAVAFGTVALTEMSRAAVSDDQSAFARTMMFSLRNLLFLTFPLAAFLFLFGEDILRLLFFRGAFGERELSETLYALRFYVFGIPAFAALKVTTAAFTSRKDMRTPFLVALFAIVLNIALNLILMRPLKQGGIALATVVSSCVNNLLLLFLLRRSFGERLPLRPLAVFLPELLFVSLAPLAAAWPVYRLTASLLPAESCACASPLFLKTAADFLFHLIPLACSAIVYGALTLLLAGLFRMKETESVLKQMFFRCKRT